MKFCLKKKSFYSLPAGKLYKKKSWKIPWYIGRFYRNLADNIDNFLGRDFYGKIANDYEIPSADIQNYILTTHEFAKGMQIDINHYVTKDRISNSFRQKLDPISKNILRRQNPLELVFEDISTFDAENANVGSLLKKLDIWKNDTASELITKAPRLPGVDFAIRKKKNWKIDQNQKMMMIIFIYCLYQDLHH